MKEIFIIFTLYYLINNHLNFFESVKIKLESLSQINKLTTHQINKSLRK